MSLDKVQKYDRLQKDFQKLLENFHQLKIQLEDLKQILPKLQSQNADLIKENYILKERIKELEFSKNLDSRNSGKPPSSDVYKKPKRTQSLRKKSNLNV